MLTHQVGVHRRGEILLEITDPMELIPRNQGSLPTFVRGVTEWFKAIIFATPDILGDMGRWKVITDYAHRVHHCIASEIRFHNNQSGQPRTGWYWKKYDVKSSILSSKHWKSYHLTLPMQGPRPCHIS